MASAFDIVEDDLHASPRFFVQAPDGKRHWAEIDRQAMFLTAMRSMAPRVYVYPNANAGKRNPAKARKEGIQSGVFDIEVTFQHPLRAQIEFKGYNGAGRAGTLRQAQIDHGNRMTDLGIPVACFFDPFDAVKWLRDLGFPVRGKVS